MLEKSDEERSCSSSLEANRRRLPKRNRYRACTRLEQLEIRLLAPRNAVPIHYKKVAVERVDAKSKRFTSTPLPARHATPEHKKALLLNALGVEELNTYLRAAEDELQPGADRPTQEETTNVYEAALALLNKLFDPQPDAACLRAQFKALRQRPDESAVQFIQEVRREAKLGEFGAASDILAFDQIVSGIASPHLQRIFSRWKRISAYRRHST
ncbi:hypothetical protein MTO96_007118 [Rhipicephalus appendiculatus]